MALTTIAVFLKGILNNKRLIANILPVHHLDGLVASGEGAELDKAVPLWSVGVRVTHDNWCVRHLAKRRESFIQKLFIHSRGKIADKQIGSDITGMTVHRRLSQPDGLGIQGGHIEDFRSVCSIDLRKELAEAVSMMITSNAIARNINVLNRACLHH